MIKKIAVIPGDGIGPEVIEASLDVLRELDLPIEFVKCQAGYNHWRKTGDPLPTETIETIRKSNALLKGPTQTIPEQKSFRSIVVFLRQNFDLYANVRPMQTIKGIPNLASDVDFVIVRENTEGLYSGIEGRMNDLAMATRIVTRKASLRIAKFAFELAVSEGRKKVTICHKATVLKESCGLFREACLTVAKEYPNIAVDEELVDTAGYKIVSAPREFDVIVTTNLFGDILSDVAAAVIGGLGIAPSANIGDSFAMFEPIHGVALEIAGKHVANPTATLRSCVMMLQYLGERDAAARLQHAIVEVIGNGTILTPDLGGKASTREFVEAVKLELNSDIRKE